MGNSAQAPPGPGPYAAGCAWIEGEYVPISEARIPILDTGFVRSDLTYDVVAVWEGRFFRLDDHLDRLLAGCERIRLVPPASRAQIRDILIEVVRRSGLREAYVETVVTRGVPDAGQRDPRQLSPRLYAYAIPYVWIVPSAAQADGTHLVVTRDTYRIPPGAVDPVVKNFHWGDLVRGLFEAYDRGGVLPVLPGADGMVTEGPGFNVFAYSGRGRSGGEHSGGVLRTPRRGVLEGITRRTVIEIAQADGLAVEAGDLPVEELYQAGELFLTSTAGGIMPVTTLDGKPVGDGRPGPVTTRIRDRYWELHRDPRYTVAVDYPGTGPVP